MHVVIGEPVIRQKIRVVADTPELAANAIRERLGRRAEVLSIRSIAPQGWTRWFQKNKIEVIAGLLEEVPESLLDEEIPSQSQPLLSEKESATWVKMRQIFEDAGFREEILSTAAFLPQWDDWAKMPIAQGLQSVKKWLINCYTQFPQDPLMQRVAFIGPTGSGSTTALGKFLAKNYFNLPGVQVLKLDREETNSDESLRNFCELFGISFSKDPVDLPYVDFDKHLWIDVPGVPLKEIAWDQVKVRLNALSVDTRILVVHSGYDKDCLHKLGYFAQAIGITHLVLSHWDEIDSSLHLWPFLLQQNLPVLGLSAGGDLTGHWTSNPLACLLEKTFPA